jgi:hypothetical protein
MTYYLFLEVGMGGRTNVFVATHGGRLAGS